jgi:electron transport complex protein RnfB
MIRLERIADVSDDIYRRLAGVLDTLPNGFPSTPDGLEIRILQKIFTPEEAELFCDLKLTPEPAAQIAERTGRPLEGLEDQLISMAKRGEIVGVKKGDIRVFAMVPWVVGIYEFQIDRMDRELCEMFEEYLEVFGPPLTGVQPQIMQSIPIEKEIPSQQEAMPYEQVSHIIEQGKSFRVGECICKKEQGILGHPCEKSIEVCLSVMPVEGVEPIREWGRPISKEEAYAILKKPEEEGLVHLSGNVENGQSFFCNCCGCCCGVLRAINELNVSNVVNAHFCAEIDEDDCTSCGICLEERCQVRAIEEVDDTYRVIPERCIGCGLCVTDCPTEAIRLLRRSDEEIVIPPKNSNEWNDRRARQRGVDYGQYR